MNKKLRINKINYGQWVNMNKVNWTVTVLGTLKSNLK